MSDVLLRRVGRLAALVAASFTIAIAPGQARTVAIDQGEFIDIVTGSECTIGAACTPFILPFDVTGSGSNTSLFIYRNGFVSLGGAVNSANAAADFSQYGVPTIAPLAYPEANLGTLAFGAGAYVINDPTTLQYATPLKNSGSPIVVVSFRQNDNGSGDFGDMFLLLTKSGANLQFEFTHGGKSFADLFRFPNSTGAFLGYQLPGGSLKLAGASTNLITTPFIYTVPILGATNGVPEPATWALMIGGFGLAGAALRRRRAEPLPA